MCSRIFPLVLLFWGLKSFSACEKFPPSMMALGYNHGDPRFGLVLHTISAGLLKNTVLVQDQVGTRRVDNAFINLGLGSCLIMG